MGGEHFEDFLLMATEKDILMKLGSDVIDRVKENSKYSSLLTIKI